MKENQELGEQKRIVTTQAQVESRKSMFQSQTIDMVCTQLSLQEKKIRQLEVLEKTALESVQNTLRAEKVLNYKYSRDVSPSLLQIINLQ